MMYPTATNVVDQRGVYLKTRHTATYSKHCSTRMMHPALQIREILHAIFGHCRLGRATCDLPALARTCHTFKEPVLDVLWATLFDPSPLARCLPEAFRYWQKSAVSGWKHYWFCRSLKPNEWKILRSYTRRTRTMLNHTNTFDWESVDTLLNPPATEPLFPNLRHLYCGSAVENKGLLYMPFPSLESLGVGFSDKENYGVLRRAFESFSQFSPNIKELSLHALRHDAKFSDYFSTCISRWRNLQNVDRGPIALSADALDHLPRMPGLTRRTFALTATLPDQISDVTLIFPNLQELKLRSEYLEPISQLLSRTRLPATTDFAAFVDKCPSKLGVSSFLTGVQSSCTSSAIQKLHLEQSFPIDGDYIAVDHRPVLGSEDLQLCTTFDSLCSLSFDLEWDVNLTSSDLLTLTPAWPHLEELPINGDWGWNSQGGITPDGLLQLLQTCQSLKYVALAMDTRGYTDTRRLLESPRLTLPSRLSINVVDSFIGPESVSAIAMFLVNFLIRSDFSFTSWGDCVMEDTDGCSDLWHQAYKRAESALPYARLFMGCLLGFGDTESIGEEQLL